MVSVVQDFVHPQHDLTHTLLASPCGLQKFWATVWRKFNRGQRPTEIQAGLLFFDLALSYPGNQWCPCLCFETFSPQN